MIKFFKRLWKKYFGKKEVLVVPKPKPIHCASHKRYMKSCLACREAVK